MIVPASPRKKVFIDALPLSMPNLSGIGHVVWHIIAGLEQDELFLRDHELILIASRKRIPHIKTLGFKNVQYKPWPIKPRIVNALNYYNLLPPIDLFMGRGTYLFGNFTTWPLFHSKSITYVHDIGYERYPNFAKPSVYKMLHKSVPKWLKRTTAIVTVSNNAKSEIHDFYHTPLKKLTVIYNGIDAQQFYPRTKKEISKVCTMYGLDKPYILFLSNLEPRKNLEKLIEAFAALPIKQRAATTLFLIGSEGWQDEAIRATIARSIAEGCDIRKPDHYVPDSDMPALISGAELLAHPAIYEGFGMSVLEPNAFSTPKLVSKTSSLPEVAGDAGMYVDHTSVDDISRQLSRLLHDEKLRDELRQRGLIQSRQFSWENATKNLIKLIQQIESKNQ